MHDQVRNCYPSYTMQFDQLRDDQVIWEPYTHQIIVARYPFGISLLCRRDQQYWLTQPHIIFDVMVEEMAQHRVMRQFGRRQLPDPPIRLPRLRQEVHRLVLVQISCLHEFFVLYFIINPFQTRPPRRRKIFDTLASDPTALHIRMDDCDDFTWAGCRPLPAG